MAMLASDIDTHAEWFTVIAFYKALHVVEFLFAADKRDGEHCHTHDARHQKLKTTQRYQNIWKNYQPLFNASVIARYLESRDTSVSSLADYFSDRGVINQCVRWLNGIESFAVQQHPEKAKTLIRATELLPKAPDKAPA